MDVMTVTKAAFWLRHKHLHLQCFISNYEHASKVQSDWKRYERLESMRLSVLLRIVFTFVYGVKGNERADMFAGNAEISAGLAMDHANVFHAFHEASRVEDSGWEGDSTTFVKLKFGHVKLSTTRHNLFVDSNRVVVNQMITDTVSRYTL
jgi:hypothetical protein